MVVKLQHIRILTELLLNGANNNFISITTKDLAGKINRSQQLASKELIDMESLGYIERSTIGKTFSIKVTKQGYLQVYNMFSLLQTAINFPTLDLEFEGTIVSGMGEGGYYISLDGYKKQFREKLGYDPYPGTLNVKLSSKIYLDARNKILQYPCIFIPGFSNESRTFGWVKCYPSIINESSEINCAILILERTHYDDHIIEVIAPFSIKDKFSLKSGDKIKLKVG
ncbi:MAG: DUF120 domain-containing protein [Nitrososphaeraceae archaeon]